MSSNTGGYKIQFTTFHNCIKEIGHYISWLLYHSACDILLQASLYISFAQITPVNPARHLHVNLFTLSMHVPPFLDGLLLQSITCKRDNYISDVRTEYLIQNKPIYMSEMWHFANYWFFIRIMISSCSHLSCLVILIYRHHWSYRELSKFICMFTN